MSGENDSMQAAKKLDCKHELIIYLGQSVKNFELVWYETQICRNCNYTTEADGSGFPPDWIRKLLLSRDGLWCLAIDVVDKGELNKIFMRLRKQLKISLKDLSLLKTVIPGPIISGTKAEMEWLLLPLKQSGITVVNVRPCNSQETSKDILSFTSS